MISATRYKGGLPTWMTVVGLVLLCAALPALAKDNRVSDKEQVQNLEKSVAVVLGEQGFDAYSDLFHPEYNNWADGGDVLDRTAFLAGVRRWYEAGNKAVNTSMQPISIEIFGDLALSRYRLREDFNNGKTFVGNFTSLARKHNGKWKLYRTSFTTLFRGATAEVPAEYMVKDK